VAVIVCGPTVVGVYETAQELETKPVPGSVVEPESVHVRLEKVPVFDQLTVPVGAVAIPPAVVSVTVAVQLLVPPTGTLAGLQDTEVVVRCAVAVTVAPPVEPRWLASPA